VKARCNRQRGHAEPAEKRQSAVVVASDRNVDQKCNCKRVQLSPTSLPGTWFCAVDFLPWTDGLAMGGTEGQNKSFFLGRRCWFVTGGAAGRTQRRLIRTSAGAIYSTPALRWQSSSSSSAAICSTVVNHARRAGRRILARAPQRLRCPFLAQTALSHASPS
jgi:hypothetical protein